MAKIGKTWFGSEVRGRTRLYLPHSDQNHENSKPRFFCKTITIARVRYILNITRTRVINFDHFEICTRFWRGIVCGADRGVDRGVGAPRISPNHIKAVGKQQPYSVVCSGKSANYLHVNLADFISILPVIHTGKH